ncbi:toprim domain-containing protein, partial [Campylobacter lanienae]|uniref:toprim domain-containing protein n=1 Tax=Campylobacter lanienae TaxID=75658 RepID=UPI00112F8A0D
MCLSIPIDFYHEFDSDIVVICEGEKDAINLCSLGVCALTLGGVNNSWQKHKELLRDKIV